MLVFVVHYFEYFDYAFLTTCCDVFAIVGTFSHPNWSAVDVEVLKLNKSAEVFVLWVLNVL